MGTHSDPHDRFLMSNRFDCLPFIEGLAELCYRNRHKGNRGGITNETLRRCRSDRKVGVSSFRGRAVRTKERPVTQ
jgi:hypothetical protein